MRSVVSSGTFIDCRSHIKDCVILPQVKIGKECRISKAIIDKSCVIPDGTIIGENLDEDRKKYHVSPEGIVLVTPTMLKQNLFSFEGI